ncbi:MAG TPA: hypothetical protein H9922_05940 [Candidatus Phocaeicola caecigallinarum]|nr:hypothetical protein [Candidatus Phocaeicola caecigallinarum]
MSSIDWNSSVPCQFKCTPAYGKNFPGGISCNDEGGVGSDEKVEGPAVLTADAMPYRGIVVLSCPPKGEPSA